MSKKLNGLLEQRAKAWEQMKALDARADEEKRSLTADENGQWDSYNKEIEEFDDAIKREERSVELERSMAQKAFVEEDVRMGKDVDIQDEYRVKYFDVIGKEALGKNAVNQDDMRSLGECQTRLLSAHPEIRTYQVDKDTYGGYLVPKQFVNELIAEVDNIVVIRPKARVLPVNGRVEIEIPRKTARANGATWTGEISDVTEDTSLRFGMTTMKPNTMTSLIKVSRALLRSGAMSVDGIIRSEMAYDFAIAQEEAFMTGSGANQPLGLFTANAAGISTDRDMSTGNSTTAITMDNLYNNIYNLKPQHRMKAEWLFSRTAIKEIRKLKDGDGNYLWQPSNILGQPNALLSYPVMESEYVPTTFTTGLYVGMLGDFSHYYIEDDIQIEIQVLQELYAANNQIGYIGRAGVDGAPVLEEAFSRITLG